MNAPQKIPSTGSEHSEYRSSQGRKYPIYDGRHPRNGAATMGPPIEIFHPCFEEFLENLTTVKPSEQDLRVAAKLAAISSTIYQDENARDAAILPLIQAFLTPAFDKRRNADGTTPDASLFTFKGEATDRHRILKAVAEWKNEIGTGNSAPNIQCGLSVLNILKLDDVSVLNAIEPYRG
jgi:hypothetical protein